MRDRLTAIVDRIPPTVRALAALLVFAAIATWLTANTWSHLRASRLDVGPLTDFRDAIYYPLVALRDGVNPYAVDLYFRHYPVGQEFPLYTPLHLLLHSPLLLFSFRTARGVFWGWNLALVVGFAATLLRLARLRVTVAGVLGLASVIMITDAGKFDLRSGQPTLMIVIAFLLAWRALPRPAPAGVSVAVGVIGVAIVWSKPTYAIPLVVLLSVCSRWRLAARGTALAIALSAVVLPWLVDAAGGFGPLVDSLRESARVTSRSNQSRLGTGIRIDFANTFVRITHLHYSETVGAILGLVLLGAGAWLVARLHRHRPAADTDELMVTLVCVLTLVGTYHVPYDYLLLLAPIVMLARPAPSLPTAWPRRVRVAVPVLLALPVLDPLGWSPVNAVLGKSGFEWMLHPTMLCTYVLVALGLTAWAALRQLRLPASPPAAATAAP
jgi:hypothetical protein